MCFRVFLVLALLLPGDILWGVTRPVAACLSTRFSVVDRSEEYSDPDTVLKQIEISKRECFKKFKKCLLTLYIFRENGYGAYCGK